MWAEMLKRLFFSNQPSWYISDEIFFTSQEAEKYFANMTTLSKNT